MSREAPLVLVSNRGPVTFRRGPDGEMTTSHGGGGLVTALSGLIERTPALWISAATTEGDAVQCWGDDAFGKSTPPDGVEALHVETALRGDHSCALSPGGEIRCWGDDLFGQASAP